MGREDYPVTTGVRFLRDHKIPFEPCLYHYEEHGGTSRAASELGVPEHSVIKTLVFAGDGKSYFLVLMHGDREVSAKQLARTLGMKQVTPCDVAMAQRLTGYMVGGISPFGTRSPLPVYVEESIFPLPRIYINGGKRGFLVSMNPAQLGQALGAVPVAVGIEA